MRFRQPSTSRPGHNPHDVPGGPSVRASNSSYVGSDPGTGRNYRAHMDQVLAGVRVVEVATWTFVPAAGAVLADWGADVIKVEHPVTGDPQRGLMTSGLMGGGGGIPNFMMEQP